MSQAVRKQTIPLHPSHRHQVRTLDRREAQDSKATANKVYCLFQWKDELDESAPLWKKLYFWLIYRPFNQFSRFVLKVPSYNGETEDGRLWYFDFQGASSSQWRAEQRCETRNWAYKGMALDEDLQDRTTVECKEFNYPLTDISTREKYQSNGRSVIEVPKIDMERLAAKVCASDALIEKYYAKGT